MLTYDQALQLIIDTVQPLPPVEAALAGAAGKVLAEPVTARWDLPGADNAAMDGFALAGAGVAAGRTLPVSGFLPAGAAPAGPVAPGQAVRIMTGAPLPQGCDTVVPFEETEVAEGSVRLLRDLQVGQHVRRKGEEFRAGEVILPAGTLLQPGEIGLLASAGAARIRVRPTPRVAVLSTGDELIEVGQQPGPGQIVNSNAYLLAARLGEEGYPVRILGAARDNPGDLRRQLEEAGDVDLLLTTGGVSIGDHDFVQQTIIELGYRVIFWKVAIKPGKPVLFAARGARPFFGLPGNPAATAATFELFVRPALRRLAGHPNPHSPQLQATLAAAIKGDKRQRFIWGRLDGIDGQYQFIPAPTQGSGQNRCMQQSTALLPVPADSPGLAAGAIVKVILLRLPRG